MRSIFDFGAVRRSPLLLLLAVVLTAGMIAGCGGGDDDGSAATTPAESPASQEGDGQAQEAPAESKADGEEEQPAPSGGDKDGQDGDKEGQAAEEAGAADGPAKFEVPPNRHKDSGGGSKQFRQPGGDNSIQDSGREADQATFDEIAAIVHAFLDARAAGDAEESCKYLSSGITDQLLELAKQSDEIEQTCAAIVEALTGSVPAKVRRQIAKADIGSVRVDGDSGFVLYRGAEKGVYVLPIVRENGQWRVSALAGSLLP